MTWLGLFINTLRAEQNGRHLADNIYKCISIKENDCTLIQFQFNFVFEGSINIKLWLDYIDGFVQDCSNSIANALELLQSCAKPSV